MGDHPGGAFSQTPKGVLHVEDIRAYIYYKFESIGDSDIYEDLDKVYNNDKSFKEGF